MSETKPSGGFVRLPYRLVDDVQEGRKHLQHVWLEIVAARHTNLKTGRVTFTLKELKVWCGCAFDISHETLRRWIRTLNESGETRLETDEGAGSKTWRGGFIRDDLGVPPITASDEPVQLPTFSVVRKLHIAGCDSVELPHDLHKTSTEFAELSSRGDAEGLAPTAESERLSTPTEPPQRATAQIQEEVPAAAELKTESPWTEASYARVVDSAPAATDRAEAPRESEIREVVETLPDRDHGSFDQIAPIARQLPRDVWTHVVQTHCARCASGVILNRTGLFVSLLRYHRRGLVIQAGIEAAAAAVSRTPEEEACLEAIEYARERLPWDVAEGLLLRMLRRRGVSDIDARSVIAAALSAYQGCAA